MALRKAIVVTSIYDGQFLENYVRQILREEQADNCDIIVIPDNKTSPDLYKRVANLRAQGFAILCPNCEEQDDYLSKIGPVSTIIPYNSCNRRNVGFLLAYERGYDFIISMDDDNLCLLNDAFLQEHSVVAQGPTVSETVHSSNGWFNVCELLELDRAHIFPRGFPYHARLKQTSLTITLEKQNVHLNAGLWLQDPDLDALTWLSTPARAVSFKNQSLVLGPATWSPINTQNTAIYRDLIACYYYFRMNSPIQGIPMQRYGDIFSGYFSQACVKHLGFSLRVGSPVVNHLRHAHNYAADLMGEWPGIWLLEDIAQWLKQQRLQGKNYAETYLCLADFLDEAVGKFSGSIWDDSSRGYFHQMANNMRIWIKALETLSGVRV